MSRKVCFLQHRGPMRINASLTGWGAVMEGCSAQGLWSSHPLWWHINYLDLMAVYNALRYFLPDLRGHLMLDRTVNTSVVSFINHQGSVCSHPLCKLAYKILLWSLGKLLSLTVVYIPGHWNIRADILSRQGLRPGKWRLHTEVVEHIWGVYG